MWVLYILFFEIVLGLLRNLDFNALFLISQPNSDIKRVIETSIANSYKIWIINNTYRFYKSIEGNILLNARNLEKLFNYNYQIIIKLK